MRPDVAMRTIAQLVAYVVLGLLLILLGIMGAALAILWPPLGGFALCIGAGARVLHEQRHTTLRP